MFDVEKLSEILLRGTVPELDIELPVALVPHGVDLSDLRPFLPCPRAHTGAYRTDDLASFAAYLIETAGLASYADREAVPAVLENATEPPAARKAHVFVSPDGNSAHAVLSFGTAPVPAWHDLTADLVLEDSPAFAALKALVGKPVTQDQIVDFIDDWDQHCAFVRQDGSALDTAAARKEFVDLTVETLRKLKSSREDFKREVTATERLTMQPTLPNRLIFTCAPWRGLLSVPVRVRLAASDSGGGVGLKLTLIGWGALREQLAEQLADEIRAIPANLTVLRGRFERPGGR
jgi:uncharacterized protein YfdQ (DUF2303 family)